MDSFSILGIAPDASAVEIKQAYRRMAMAWHPDRSTHPEATERFKQIRAAYEALQQRDTSTDAEGDSSADEAAAARAADVRLDLEVSLEEAAFGCRKEVVFERALACVTCGGSGEAGISRSRPCRLCHGSGRVRDGKHGLEVCANCGGRGFLSQRICPDCDGGGNHVEQVSLQVTVPAGMLDGDELRLAGQGNPGNGDSLAPGDLFLRLIIRRHPLFEVSGSDLTYAMPVNVLTLLAGGWLDVTTLDGSERVEVSAGDVSVRTVRLAGRGYPARRRAQPGDLVIQLQPVMPRQLNRAQSELLQKAAIACEETLDACLPEIAAWRRRFGV